MPDMYVYVMICIAMIYNVIIYNVVTCKCNYKQFEDTKCYIDFIDLSDFIDYELKWKTWTTDMHVYM